MSKPELSLSIDITEAKQKRNESERPHGEEHGTRRGTAADVEFDKLVRYSTRLFSLLHRRVGINR
jgi:hypothetical protein